MIERAAASGVSLRRRRLQLRVGAAGALLAVTIALTSAADASAAIRIQRRTITVSGVGGLVSITRAPFGIAFTDRRGNRVLAEVPATSHTTTIRPASAPTVGGDNLQKSATLYAPLAFTVGSERESVFVGLSPEGDRLVAGQHEGDLIQSVRTGSVYSARAVRSIRRLGHGVRLVLSTTDPSGRRMILTVTPDQAGTFRVSAQPIPSHGVIGIADSFTSVRQEAFHGFGGVHDGLDQHGRDFYSRVEEENADPQEFGGPPSESGLFPSGPLAAYYAQPMFVSSRAYGFLLDQPQLARFRLDSDHPDAWQADVTGRRLQYVVALGSAPRAIAALTAVTGRQRVPPAWGLGPMLDRSTPLNGTVAAYEAKVRQDLVDIARYRLPLKAYRIEGWALFPEPIFGRSSSSFTAAGSGCCCTSAPTSPTTRPAPNSPLTLTTRSLTAWLPARPPAVRICSGPRQWERARYSTSPTQRPCAGGHAVCAPPLTSARTGSCRTSGSRSCPTWCFTTVSAAPPCTTTTR